MRRAYYLVRIKMAPKKRKYYDGQDGQEDKDPVVTEKYFTWTDEEQSLLLHVTAAYKTEKATEGVDWESVRTRYEDLKTLYIERYPTNPENTEEFPNSKDTVGVFTKERITTKLKRIKLGFKKAIDSGRRSGGGRVVALLFDECSEVWSGSPAVEAIDNGLESYVEVDAISNLEESASAGLEASSLVDNDASDSTSDTSLKEVVGKTSDARRNLIIKLKEKKNSKLTKKVSVENRMLLLGQEELELKKKMIENMEMSEKKYVESMQSFATSLTSLSSTLQNGFNMLGMALQQNQPNQQYNTQLQYQPNQQYNTQRQHQQHPTNVQTYWAMEPPQFDQR